MPTVAVDGTEVDYAVDGNADRPTVALVPDAPFGPWLWGWQVPGLAGPYRTVTLAPRGTDGSDGDAPGSLSRFAADLEAVLAAVDAPRAHLFGAGLPRSAGSVGGVGL